METLEASGKDESEGSPPNAASSASAGFDEIFNEYGGFVRTSTSSSSSSSSSTREDAEDAVGDDGEDEDDEGLVDELIEDLARPSIRTTHLFAQRKGLKSEANT